MTDLVWRWDRLSCDLCGGHGQVSGYTIDGGDFVGADECRDCAGSGFIWRSPNGALAQWPGGPFIGREARALREQDVNIRREE